MVGLFDGEDVFSFTPDLVVKVPLGRFPDDGKGRCPSDQEGSTLLEAPGRKNGATAGVLGARQRSLNEQFFSLTAHLFPQRFTLSRSGCTRRLRPLAGVFRPKGK